MARVSKPRRPYRPPADDEVVERLIPLPGWVYNLMAARAASEKRTTKYQIAFEIEQLAKQAREESEKSPGNNQPTSVPA